MAASPLAILPNFQDQQLLRTLLKHVVDHRGDYAIIFGYIPGKKLGTGEYVTTIDFDDGWNPPGKTEHRVTWDFTNPLRNHGMMEYVDYDEIHGSTRRLRFTQEAIDWYKSERKVTDQDIHRAIGQALYDRFLVDPNQRRAHLDMTALSHELYIDQSRLIAQCQLLVSTKYCQFSGHAENTIVEGFIKLSSEKGLVWASRGFPPIGSETSPNVEVHVQVSVHTFIDQVQHLDIDPRLKRDFELMLRRFKDESEKDRPSYQPVKDGLEMINSSQSLARIGWEFFSKHMGTIHRMIDNIPGV